MKKTLFLAILSFGIPMSMAEEPRATVVPVVESSDEETGTTEEEDVEITLNEDEEGDYEGDYEEEEDIVYTDEQKAEALEKLKARAAASLEALRGVSNKETADAASPVIDESNKIIREITPILRQLDQEEVMSIIYKSREDMGEEIGRLIEQNFYGSTDLAAMLTGSSAMAKPVQPLPDELKERFIIKEGTYKFPAPEPIVVVEDGAVKLQPEQDDDKEEEEENGIELTGGPGFTQQTAWVFRNTTNQELKGKALSTYADVIVSKINMDEIFECNLDTGSYECKAVYTNGKVYCYLKVDLLPDTDGDRYLLEQWLDITPYSLFSTEEELQKYNTESLNFILEAMKLLVTVKDKDSADAAAASLLEIKKKITPKHIAATNMLSPEERRKSAEQMAENLRTMSNDINKLIRNKFYGSEKLKKAMDEFERDF